MEGTSGPISLSRAKRASCELHNSGDMHADGHNYSAFLRSGAPNPLTIQQEPREYQTNEEKYWLGLPTVSFKQIVISLQTLDDILGHACS